MFVCPEMVTNFIIEQSPDITLEDNIRKTPLINPLENNI